MNARLRRLSSTTPRPDVRTVAYKDINGSVRSLASFGSFRSLKSSSPSPRRTQINKNSAERIAYGTRAEEDQFPFVAYLQADGSACSGTLISSTVVLTAAHCLRKDEDNWIDISKAYVRLGSADLSDTKQYPIKNMFAPKYNTETGYGDVALIELAEQVPDIAPVQLASESFKINQVDEVTVAGWGLVDGGDFPYCLMYTTESTMSKDRCEESHTGLFGRPVPRGHMCFGLDTNPYTASCHGDSGGPFLATTENGSPVQVALVSYGVDMECGTKALNIDVATSIGFWKSWIDDVMSVHNLRPNLDTEEVNSMQEKRCYSGKPLARVQTESIGECCDECRKNKDCKAWTWRKNKSCALRAAKGSKFIKSENCMSGYLGLETQSRGR